MNLQRSVKVIGNYDNCLQITVCKFQGRQEERAAGKVADGSRSKPADKPEQVH